MCIYCQQDVVFTAMQDGIHTLMLTGEHPHTQHTQ